MIFNKSVITFLRGDDDTLTLALTDGTHFTTGDRAFFSLKASATSEIDLLQIESSNFVSYNNIVNSAILFVFNHDDTIELDFDTYYYDILVEWADGKFVTVVQPTKFILVPGGSH
jgi:hypothetical protein